jgi:ribosomal protein S24E
MKKFTFIILLLITISRPGIAQQKSSLGLFTDRDVYVSGETLLAKIYTPENNPSRIAYLDLVNQSGTRISGAALQIMNNQADGYLQLPDSLSSGTYQLRAYQKNTAGKLKIIREIWISNRFDGLEKTSQMKKQVLPEIQPNLKTDQINIQNIEPEYPTKSSLEASIQISESILNQIEGDLLVSIAQTDSAYTAASFSMQSDRSQTGMNEAKGIILSGTVTDKKTQLPAANMTVYLTIPDSVPGFQYYKTRSDGRFYFLLDHYYGSVQAIVQCYSNVPTQRLKIKMDELYAESGSQAEYVKRPVPEPLKANISRNIDAVTLQKIFEQNKFKFLEIPAKSHQPYPYYGKPTQTIDPQLFTDLPDFTEVSRELLPGVKFRNYNNEPSLTIWNAPMHNYFEEKPLVLIDGIPIQDLNVIKEMGSADIDRVDVCQSERFYGDLRFAGVVAIYTTKADYSKLSESDQLIRLKLDAIQPPATLNEQHSSEPNIPDLRQVIYWNPSTTPQTTLPVKCNISSVLGQYKLVVRGRLKDGTLIFTEKQFEVK